MTTLEREKHSDPLDAIRPAVDLNDILVLQQQARAVGVVCPLKLHSQPQFCGAGRHRVGGPGGDGPPHVDPRPPRGNGAQAGGAGALRSQSACTMRPMQGVESPWVTVWEKYCVGHSREILDSADWLLDFPVWDESEPTPIAVSDWLGRLFCIHFSESSRKSKGQYFTSPSVARFMTGLPTNLDSTTWLLEPAAGAGILVAAVAEEFVAHSKRGALRVTAYEEDPDLSAILAIALGFTRHWLKKHDIRLKYEVVSEDFIVSNAHLLRPAPLLDDSILSVAPNLIVANPPYFKIPKSDSRASLLREVVHGQPNIYSLFMAAAAKMLAPGGQLVFITPRSFCSGPYFRQFRHWFFSCVALTRVHLFESRTAAFRHDDILQENVIVAGVKQSAQFATVGISTSSGRDDLETVAVRNLPGQEVLDLSTHEAVLNIPTNGGDGRIRSAFARWPDRLGTLGMKVSTGPIVPFRTPALGGDANGSPTAPLLWIQNVSRMKVVWPLSEFAKPQHVLVNAETLTLLLPNRNYVLVRRFSPKEENSRITAAPYFADQFSDEVVGIENHLNYIYRPTVGLTEAETVGLAAFLNSLWVDQYFRLSSGNTQVSATELRTLPFPPLAYLQRIGESLLRSKTDASAALINDVVGQELNLTLDPPDTYGGHMPKLEEAKDLLAQLGLPPAQRNEMAALTLLAMADLGQASAWKDASRRSIRVHDIIQFIEQRYHRRYAENTRETIRRQVLHQFEQARLVDLNPDDPNLATNSPKTHYALSEDVLPVIRTYGAVSFSNQLRKFQGDHGVLLESYQRRRVQTLIPLKDSTGQEWHLSPGRHNQLQVAVVEQFAPRFAPGAKLLYLGDTANKSLLMDTRALRKLGYPVDKHGKLPDIVLYVPRTKTLFLVEAVTSHGPVSPKRKHELESQLSESTASRIYVSAFPNFKEYLRHAGDIAWETEIWIAEAPDHLIHYNGDKFLRPRRSRQP